MNVLPYCLLILGYGARAFGADAVMYSQNWRTEIHAGPGAYFPPKGILEKGAAVTIKDKKQGWARVVAAGFAAGELWVAETALGPKPPSYSIFDKIRGRPAAKRFVPVTAAVRGFAQRHGRAKPASLKALDAAPDPAISAEDLAAFKAQGGLAAKPASKALGAYAPTEAEMGVGVGVAASLAARGVVADKAAARYLNLIAASLAEASGAYDARFRVIVSAGKETNAVAVPGGWIFVTVPLIKACRDESELAAVLAHEMTHVIERHGLKEMKQREVQTRAEEAMAEMDEMAGPGPDEEAMAELDELAESAYDSIHKPRLASYEEEADRGAVQLLARAGYDVGGVTRMLDRVAGALASEKSKDNPFASSDFGKRRSLAEAAAKQAGSGGAANADRFRRSLSL